ncbi:hypothetical protein HGRIS_012523 [Hohenbuehelia grisea]|uniref:Mucoidy inhibitor A n=1 Tax=Hohenbuehelia grisea TaxID=104357 RepID=A0ABR3ISR9_9AGAR
MSSSSSKLESSHAIELVSVEASKIKNVSLYTGRAEVTRVYPFEAKAGKNKVKISGLPSVLHVNSLRVRVEGQGTGTIHGVSVIPTPTIDGTASSDGSLPALVDEQRELEMSLTRAKKFSASLDTYLSTVTPDRISAENLAKTFEEMEITAKKLDTNIVELEKKLKDVAERLNAEYEKEQARSSQEGGDLGKTVVVDVLAVNDGNIEIALIYAVNTANWTSGYDIRVDTQSKEQPVTLIYKAAITQLTGESWDDVPLSLENICPTPGIGLPTLGQWRLTAIRGSPASQPLAPPSLGRRRTSLIALSGRETESDISFEEIESEKDSLPRSTTNTGVDGVVEKTGPSTTYQVPGTVSVPSDGHPHDVVITELKLAANMSWVCVPRIDTRVHLKANVKNDSDILLLPGTANVFVDGSFISKSEIPLVKPKVSFDCSLGIDPSIRITCHPLSCTSSQSGLFYARSVTRSYAQKLTVHNTKDTDIEKLTILDHVPIPEDSQINVRLMNPALTLPTLAKPAPGATTSGGKGASQEKADVLVPPPAIVAEGVIAQWAHADEPDVDAASLGRDGKFAWVCALPPQAKVDMLSQWEVTAPASLTLSGL